MAQETTKKYVQNTGIALLGFTIGGFVEALGVFAERPDIGVTLLIIAVLGIIYYTDFFWPVRRIIEGSPLISLLVVLIGVVALIFAPLDTPTACERLAIDKRKIVKLRLANQKLTRQIRIVDAGIAKIRDNACQDDDLDIATLGSTLTLAIDRSESTVRDFAYFTPGTTIDFEDLEFWTNRKPKELQHLSKIECPDNSVPDFYSQIYFEFQVARLHMDWWHQALSSESALLDDTNNSYYETLEVLECPLESS